jgi:EAL domain-containing protein (putative c-di-GMP-specific phosphodiesterase class I)
VKNETERETHAAGASRATKARVLVVDDELAVARAYARALTSDGYEVETAGDGDNAQGLLETSSFDVIVSDVQMPGKGGIDVLRAARARDLDVSVILVTGTPSEEVAARAVENGALLYLTKPIDHRTLLQVVHNGARMTAVARLKRAANEPLGAMHAGDRAGLEVTFRRALDGLWMAYQPIVRWPARTVFGYEALLRSDEAGFSHPAALIDAAAQLEQHTILGRAIRDFVARSFADLPEGALMFVNVHARDLEDPHLFAVDSPLSRFASRIVLEITERASLDKVPNVVERISSLRKLGYRIALDDFGNGYAGLSTFARLRPDVVKIDLSIVQDIHRDDVKRQLVAAMVDLCRSMNVDVVAEGVQSEDERSALLDLGCQLFQGFLFARPAAPFPKITW